MMCPSTPIRCIFHLNQISFQEFHFMLPLHILLYSTYRTLESLVDFYCQIYSCSHHNVTHNTQPMAQCVRLKKKIMSILNQSIFQKFHIMLLLHILLYSAYFGDWIFTVEFSHNHITMSPTIHNQWASESDLKKKKKNHIKSESNLPPA